MTPLTTLINKLVEGGVDLIDAQAKVKSALGITAVEDLTTFDPIAAALSGGASAASGVEIATAVSFSRTLRSRRVRRCAERLIRLRVRMTV